MTRFIRVNPEGCTGCRMCEMVCSLHRFGECNPERSVIRVLRHEGQGLAEPVPVVCQHCDTPACMDVCPLEAIAKDMNTGLVTIDPDTCTGCGECVTACPAGCIFLDAHKDKAMVCDLCGDEPMCIRMCHSGSLQFEERTNENSVARVQRLAELIQTSKNASRISGEER